MKSLLKLGMALVFALSLYTPVHAEVTGQDIYNKNCKKCHGKDGEGKKSEEAPDKFKYEPLNNKPREEMEKKIKELRAKFSNNEEFKEKEQKKAAEIKSRLKDDAEIKAVLDYIETLKK